MTSARPGLRRVCRRSPEVLGILLFCGGVVISLAASWLLVSRLERLGERAGFSEAWLGLVAALAADAPEITLR